MGAGYFAWAQLGPKPMSTTSGTRSSVTVSITSRTHRLDAVALLDRDLEHELVVHGEQHPRGEAAVVERAVEVDHRELEDVGRRPLHRRVLRHALPHLADAEVVGRELGDLAPATEDRGGVAPLLRLPTVSSMNAFTFGKPSK